MVNNVFEQKAIRQTDRNWDLAIAGSGFFPLLDTNTGETLYTRLGHFELDHQGWIVLIDHPHLRLIAESNGKRGALNFAKVAFIDGLTTAGSTFDDDAKMSNSYGGVYCIYSNGEVNRVAQLIVAKLFNNAKLKQVAPHVYRPEPGALPVMLAAPTEKGLGRIVSRSLEEL